MKPDAGMKEGKRMKRGNGDVGGERMTFSELREKDVINLCDGRRLGRPSDLGMNENACAVCLVVSPCGGIKGLCRGRGEEVEIPWNRIRRIGDDVILVEYPPYDSENGR